MLDPLLWAAFISWTISVDIAETASLKDRARKKLERDAGPLIIDALNDPQTLPGAPPATRATARREEAPLAAAWVRLSIP